jgi:arabinan endo-1,5-alpha-L-arabinosidase
MCWRAKAGFCPIVERLEGRVVMSSPRRRLHHPLAPNPAQNVAPATPPPVVQTAQTPSPSTSPADSITNLTDVSLIKQDDTYHLFSSGDGITERTSKDLVHWQPAGQVFAGVPAWAARKVPGAQSIWAPDISYFNAEYHLYYAVSDYGTNQSVIGFATSPTLDPSSPDYHWTDRGEVIESHPGRTNWNAIDPQVSFDAEGQAWLAFGSHWSGIKLARIDPATGGLAGGPHATLKTLATRPAGRPIEAPFIFAHDGDYYLFVSFDLCCIGSASTYKIMVGRSTSIAGPYVDRDGTPMTRGGGTLVLAGDARFRGPGSNSVFSDGGRAWIAYHAYDALNGGVPTLQIRPLQWDQDGWPVAGPPLF